MNSKKEMIIIDGKIVTNGISYCKYNERNRTYRIKYKCSPSFYNFSAWRVEFITNPDILNPYDYMLLRIKNYYQTFNGVMNLKVLVNLITM